MFVCSVSLLQSCKHVKSKKINKAIENDLNSGPYKSNRLSGVHHSYFKGIYSLSFGVVD